MTVREYKINRELIADFFHSMKMDLTDRTYQTESFNRYIYGSAEVVGLMCLRVFIENNNELYEKLKPYATALGAAFQKVNFLRDMKDDYQTRGREYFPDFNFQQFTTEMKRRIEADIEKDFQSAARGIAMLPLSSRLGVYTAYVYYRELFSKIQSSSPAQVLDSRIRISDSQKAYLMLRSYVRHKLNWL
jgi:phytoene/squalene synthetase